MLTMTHRSAETSQPRSLPEHLGSSGAVLLTADCAAALLCIAVFGAVHLAAPAFLCIATILVAALAMGRYRVSYALNTRDAFYECAAVAALGMPIALIVTLALGFEWWATVPAAALWVAGGGALSVVMFGARRGNQRYVATAEDHGRARPGMLQSLQLSVIRVLDAIISLVALIVGSPLLAVIALRIARQDGAPVLFAQRRVGRDETDFLLFKFRTMKLDSSEAWVTPDDPRVTPLGASLRKSSLDELPQLMNVLTGSMSLVGPRPEMREYADRFSQSVRGYSWRHVVRPGLTGWAQLHLPRNLRPEDAPEVLEYDLFYVENISVYLYLFSLMKTACELSRHRAV